MVKQFSVEYLEKRFSDKEFIEGYNAFREGEKDIARFHDFVCRIEINKKYFRLDMGKTGYRKKYHKQNLSEDTKAIKEIQSYLNKLTEKNAVKLIQEIRDRVEGREYIYKMIVESLVEKCVIYPQYNQLYLMALHEIYGHRQDMKHILLECIEESYKGIIEMEITQESEYLTFCAKNKRLDKLIGHSMLLTECEKRELVYDKIHPSIASLLGIIEGGESDEESYKCVQCLYEIMKSLYGEGKEIPASYLSTIQSLIDGGPKPKIKYKLMDIVERR